MQDVAIVNKPINGLIVCIADSCLLLLGKGIKFFQLHLANLPLSSKRGVDKV
jgi:hypothetical protein